MNTGHDHETALPWIDAAIRARHQEALAQLSPRVRAQLAQRRHAALRGEAPAGRRPPLLPRPAAWAFAALFACAIGLGFLPETRPGGDAAPATSLAAGNGGAAGATILDEDPEFYAWLASADAQLVAME